MQFKIPKNTDKYQWTLHSIEKMKYYGLSAQRVLRVIRNPQRVEEGIVEKTIAVMQPASLRSISASRGRPASGKNKKTWSSEIWAMYQLRRNVGASSKSPARLASESVAGRQILNSKQTQKSKFQKLPASSADWQAINKKRIKIISAWRYPGISPKKDPIPSDILDEIENII
ncbi:MAG TPA: hypothetical protein ENG89_00920 [Candidatus Moranbacteria bacterium]|nr:hypothetical protein [Candidatus Moranbacteria bacterium]